MLLSLFARLFKINSFPYRLLPPILKLTAYNYLEGCTRIYRFIYRSPCLHVNDTDLNTMSSEKNKNKMSLK